MYSFEPSPWGPTLLRLAATCQDLLRNSPHRAGLARGSGRSVGGMVTPADAAAHFASRLAFETDVSDVFSAIASGSPDFVLIDTRSLEAWKQGHARGAIHMPKPDMPSRIPAEFAPGTSFVVYCWGPGCNGATRAGLIISELGYPVKEMIGGFEYWAREGLPVDRIAKDLLGNEVSMDATRPVDALTNIVRDGAVFGGGLAMGAAVGAIACDC